MYARSSAQSPLPPAAHVQTEKQCQHRNNDNPSRGNYAPQACSGSSGGHSYWSSRGSPQASKVDIQISGRLVPVPRFFLQALQDTAESRASERRGRDDSKSLTIPIPSSLQRGTWRFSAPLSHLDTAPPSTGAS